MKLEKDKTISHYKILSRIGMGEVYLTEDTKPVRLVAIECLKSSGKKRLN